jgi:hypothetical protein
MVSLVLYIETRFPHNLEPQGALACIRVNEKEPLFLEWLARS